MYTAKFGRSISENSLRFVLNYEACKPVDVSAGKVDTRNL